MRPRVANVFGALLVVSILVVPLGVSRVDASHRPNPFRVGRTLVIPHAGGDGLFPENTFIAWDRTMAMGADVIDVDVRLAADGVPVAIHDPTVDRTTNGNGNVSSKTSRELASLDAGYDFNVGGAFPFRGKGHGVPTVEAVLKRYPKRLTTLDLKDQRVALVKPLCALITKLKRTRDVYVGIDVSPQVVEFRKRCPAVRTSGTDEDRQKARAARESGDTTFVSHQLVSQPSFMRDGQRRVTKESLAWSHRHDTAVLTYLIDDPKIMDELLDLGVDGIYTRRPDLLLERIDARKARKA